RSAPPPNSPASTNPTRMGLEEESSTTVPDATLKTAPLKLANISIDFESLYHYSETLGLKHPDRDRDYERVVDRFLDLFAELGVRATFFMVGADIRLKKGARRRSV